ncbi:hypothetical protein FOCC_FOCC016923, partial [Frankliniella occidentalis]
MASLNIRECTICKRGVFTLQGVPFRCRPSSNCHEKFSGANFMDPCAIPPELKGLTFLIARIHPVVSVYKLKGNQLGYSGNVINFPQEVNELATSLPHRVADLDCLMAVRSQGAGGHIDFQVRAGRVRAALLYLKTHHRYYSDVNISEENLAELPEDGCVFNQVPGFQDPHPVADTVPDVDDPTALHPPHLAAPGGVGADAVRPAPPPEGPAADLAGTSGDGPAAPSPPRLAADPEVHEEILDIHVTGVPMLQPQPHGNQVRAAVLADHRWKCCQRVHHGRVYLHVLPVLVPSRCSGPETFLIEYADGRFARHKTLRFFALNSLMRWTSLTNGRIFVRNNPMFRNMSAHHLREFLRHDRENALKGAMFYGSKLKHTRPFWQARTGELLDMVDQLKIPTPFMTLSAADLHWPD